MSPASISNYISAVWSHQRSLGMEAYSSNYILSLVLRGIKRLSHSQRKPRHPFSKQDLFLLFQEINTLLPSHLTFWCIITLAFRALLRKCHYTPSPHTLRWRDISIYPDYLSLTLPSSKTDQFGSRPHRIILNSTPGSPLCPVYWLRELARVQKPLESDFIFRIPIPGALIPVPYLWFSQRLKNFSSAIGLDPAVVSSHSLRHGGASFMSALGSDIIDIRARGSWASSAVFNYLHHSDETLRSKDNLIASQLY